MQIIQFLQIAKEGSGETELRKSSFNILFKVTKKKK